jgi:hypothetical protein
MMGLTQEDIQLITEHNRQKGYIYCEECTKETNSNYDIWINPHKLCRHLKKKMSAQEIAEAVAKYDAHSA